MVDRLFDALEAEVAQLGNAEKAETLGPRLARPHRAPLLAGTPLMTVGDATAHLLTTHPAYHIGQLSLVRRRCGLDNVI